MRMYDKIESVIRNIMLLLFCICLIVYFSVTIYKLYNPSYNLPQNVTFHVIGLANSTNTTTLVQLQFECIKFCGTDLAYPSNEKIRQCWEQCEKLGKTHTLEYSYTTTVNASLLKWNGSQFVPMPDPTYGLTYPSSNDKLYIINENIGGLIEDVASIKTSLNITRGTK